MKKYSNTDHVVYPSIWCEDPVDGLPSDPGGAPVLLLVIVVGVGGSQRLHLGLLTLTAKKQVDNFFRFF